MKNIVILGGGYAGVHAAKKFHKAFKKRKDVQVTLIDRNSYHTLMTELHEVAGERVPRGGVKISFDRIFSGKSIRIVQDEITRLDPEKQVLHSATEEYPYDYLLMGTGAESTDFNIPGVKEHSLPLWSYDDAIHIRDHIHQILQRASREKDPEKRKTALTFVVAGAGFTGVEMMGELMEHLPVLCREYGIDPEELELINVEGLGQILNMIPEKPRAKAKRYMEKKGVKILLNSLIIKADAGSFTLKDGTVIPCGTLIWTCGIKGSSFGKETGLTIGHVDRLKVDRKMRCPDHDNIFLAGDALWLLEEEKPIPQIVEAAEQTARVAVHNICSALDGRGEDVEFQSDFHGFMISIGGRYAVSHTGGISLSGFPAMALKHLVNVYYLHSVAGFNAWWTYLKHEIFAIRNKRSLLGGLVSGRLNGLWVLPLRLWLGLMWVMEGANKIGEGWFRFDLGSRSSWMFSSGVVQAGLPAAADAGSAATDGDWAAAESSADAGSAATDGEWAESAAEPVAESVVDGTSAATDGAWEGGDAAAEAVADAAGSVTPEAAWDGTETAADAVASATEWAAEGAADTMSTATEAVADAAAETWGPFWDTSRSIFSWDNPLVVWFRQTFMDGMAANLSFSFFQVMVVVVEIALGLAIMGGLFTFPAAGVSILMCLVFILSGLFSWNQIWFILAALVLLGGAGRNTGLDYWVMPWLKKRWNRTSLARKTYLYLGEPEKKRSKRSR